MTLMKRFLAALLALCLPVQAAIFNNSFTTNSLGTNFVLFPLGAEIRISAATPRFRLYNTSGGVGGKSFEMRAQSDQLQFSRNSDDLSTTLELAHSDNAGNWTLTGSLSLNQATNRLTISGGQLLLDGVPIASNTETNVTLNFYTSNAFFISGKGNSLVITQSITLANNLVSAITVNGTNPAPLINITNSGTVTWAQSGTNWTATASGGDTTATNIVTLVQSGTNAPQLDFSLVARGGVFKMVLTNNAYFGAPANVNNTDFKKAWLIVQQPSTGTCFVTWTNGFFAGPDGQTLVNDTNNGAVVIYEMVSDVFTNGLVHLFMSQKSKLMP